MGSQERHAADAVEVLGLRVDVLESDEAERLVSGWMADPAPRARVVCAANVHMVMTAWDDHGFRQLVNEADAVVADGQPVVWAQRLLGGSQRRRVRMTPDLVLRLFGAAESAGRAVGLYGGTPQTLAVLVGGLGRHFPGLRVPFAYAPPFRPLTEEEDDSVVAEIRAAGVDLLFVGVGCPKQERWMAEHRSRLACVMVGVGAAFDLLGGRTRQAPPWMRDSGLEWVFRLCQEPRRLWRRHLLNDPRYLALIAREAWRLRVRGRVRTAPGRRRGRG